MKNKKIIIFGSIAAVIAVIAGFAIYSANSKEVITVLTNRTDMVDTTFEDYAQEFESTHPGVDVEFEALTDYEGMVPQRMSTGDYGDVLIVPSSVPLSDYPEYFVPLGTEEEMAEEWQFVEKYSVDGTTYALPTGAGATGMVYNQEVMAAAGVTEVPTSADEFYAMCDQVQASTDADCVYVNYVDAWAIDAWMRGNAATAGAPDWQQQMTESTELLTPGHAIYENLEFAYELYARGYTQEDPMTSNWEQSKQMLADGEVAVMPLGAWAVPQIQSLTDNPESIKMAPWPITTTGEVAYGVGPDYAIAVNKNSENVELATEFMYFFLENFWQDAQMLDPHVGGELPEYMTVPDAATVHDTFLTSEEATAYEEVVQKAGFQWNESIVQKVIDGAIAGTPFDEIMADLAADWQAAIDATKE